MELDVKETGKYIRQYRKIAGLTQEELAQKVGISTMSIRRYESGERVATRELIKAIAAALGVDPYSLYSFDQASDALVDRMETQEQISKDCDRMNDEGLKLAGELVHLVAESPRYKIWQGPQEAAESTPAPTGGKDTAPPSDAPETPPEGK